MSRKLNPLLAASISASTPTIGHRRTPTTRRTAQDGGLAGRQQSRTRSVVIATAALAALAAACGGTDRHRYGNAIDAGPPDLRPGVDLGPPVAPHPCSSGSCLDWIAWVGTTYVETHVGQALPVSDGVVVVGGVETSRYGTTGAPIGGTTVGGINGASRPAFFARLDTGGVVVGGDEYDPSGSRDMFYDVAPLSSGNFVCVGYSNVSDRAASDHQILAVGVSPTGRQRWLMTYGATAMSSGVNFPTEYARSVAVSATDEVYVVGKVDSPYPGATGTPGGAFLLQLDQSTGSVVWARTFGTGSFTEVVVSADTVYVAMEANGGTTVDLGAAGSFPVTDSTALIVALSPTDGTPRAAYMLRGAPSATVTSLTLDGDGVLFAKSDYYYAPSTGTYYSGGSVIHLDATLTDATTLVSTTYTPEGAVRDLGGELLVSGNMPGPGAAMYAFFSVYDASGRARFTYADGADIGDVGMSAAASSTDGRVYLFGYYTRSFKFAPLGMNDSAGFGVAGYVIQATVPP